MDLPLFLRNSFRFVFFTHKKENRFFLGNFRIIFVSYFRQVYNFFFFSIRVFFHEHSRITGLQGKGEGISFTPLYHFHPLHRHLDISRAITAESSPLHKASSRTRTGNLWSPSASRLHPRLAKPSVEILLFPLK